MSFHLYDISELYSNADGSIQYIELVVGNSDGESRWQGKEISVTRGATTHTFTFPGNLPSSATANTSVLIATQGFADLGIVTPDFIVASGFLFTNGGTVDFAGVDSVTYDALPTGGTLSVNRNGSTITSSPKNFDGDSGTVPGNPIAGTNGADDLTGTSVTDYIVGLKGNDTLDGDAGDDTLKGGPGNDTYVVDSTSDVVTEAASAGTDQVQTRVTLSSLAANVENLRLLGTAALNATGNALNNVIYANSGSNVIDGGTGTDTVSYKFGATSGVTVSLLSTTSQATGGSGSDKLTNIENLTGSSFADDLTGDSGDNTLNGLEGADSMAGGAGNDKLKGKADGDSLDGGDDGDTLIGGGGDDTLFGGSGDDTLKGGGGSDTLQGDDGTDIFLFNAALGAANIDTILDFSATDDVIRLDNDVFKKLITAPGLALEAAEFAGNADGEATQADDRIIYNTTTGELFYDPDGSGAKAAVLFATLDGAPTLDADDFFVVG